MRVKFTYGLVIAIWATTPLAIKLGGEHLPPLAGLGLRIALAFAVGCVICTLGGFAGLALRRHWPLYFAASISIFPNMALVYTAAQYLPSGVISLMFGLTPFFTVLLARPILGENLFQPRKLLAIVVAGVGLLCLFLGDLGSGENGVLGFALMLASNLLFSASALWVKRLNARLSVQPLEQALGAMAFALPGMVLAWPWLVGDQPLVFTTVSVVSLVYLALCGSLLGFVAYYYLLKQISVETVSLIPLITPVAAMVLGATFAAEVVTGAMLLGAGLILLGLGIHHGIFVRKRPCRDMEVGAREVPEKSATVDL